MNLYVELVLSVLLIVVAIAMTRAKGMFTLMLLLSAFSGLMASMFALLGAPDVAFTEAVVGSGVSTLFLMGLIRKVDPSQVGHRPTNQRLAALLVAIGVGGVLIYGVSALPPSTELHTPTTDHVATDYMQRAYQDMHTPNVVTAVLADYRSFDTLIETAVVVTAAMGCLLILGKGDDDPSL